MACKPSTDSSRSARPIEKSACSAWKPRDRRNPVRYAVDGYGVFSCVIGGMIDRIRMAASVMVKSISRWAANAAPVDAARPHDYYAAMEFSLDPSFARGVLAEELARAREEIGRLGTLRALELSQQRHDARIASAPDIGTLA